MDSKEILKKIQDLQTKEHDLFSTLENGLTNGTISNTKKNDMLDKINQLTQQRVNLYDQLNISMQSSQKNLENVSVVIKDQNTAVKFILLSLKEVLALVYFPMIYWVFRPYLRSIFRLSPRFRAKSKVYSRLDYLIERIEYINFLKNYFWLQW
jgi:hypothetical protein